MGAKFAWLALLTGIAVTSPAWMSGRAGEKHQADKHKDKNKAKTFTAKNTTAPNIGGTSFT